MLFTTVAKLVNNYFITSVPNLILTNSKILPLNENVWGRLNATLFSGTDDFLMTNPNLNSTLDQKLEKYGVENMFGGNTLKVLEDIGYSTRRKVTRFVVEEDLTKDDWVEITLMEPKYV